MSFVPEPRTDPLAIPATTGLPIQVCALCEAVIDISEQEPLALVACPNCGAELTVKGIIDQFELIDVAGRGGMGVVYKAYDAKLDRHVALKLLRPEHSNQKDLISELEREAAITASINHPHVVKVFSTGVDAGRFYLVMELVDQGSLDDLIRAQGRVGETQILEIATQLAEGLRAAQQHGLIHRDVKPGNILFSGTHTAKIVDFGLAIFMTQEESVRGEIWGTPYYVAPEKLDKKPEDFRSDIYSLGASLFHALAGRPPFEAENASLVALKHLKSQPVSLQTFAPQISSATAYIINRTLLKDPNQRYQSYDELIEHFAYAREQLKVAQATPKSQKRVVLENEEAQKAWGLVTAGMIAAIILLAGLAFGVYAKMAPANGKTAGTPRSLPRAQTAPSMPEPALLREARERLVHEDAGGAAGLFQKAAADPSTTLPMRGWALLGGGIAEMLRGRSAEARNLFHELGKIDFAAARRDDAKVGAFFGAAANRMTANGAITVASTRELSRTNHESIGLLLFALKNWEDGAFEDAIALFRQFRSAAPEGANAWIAELKPVATQHIEAFTSFAMVSDRVAGAGSPAERLAAINELRQIKGPLAKRAAEIVARHAAEIATIERDLSLPPRDGLYRLVNRHSGKCIDVAAREMKDNASVHQWEYLAMPNQQWSLTSSGSGAYIIRAVHSGKPLEIANAGAADDADVRQGTASDAKPQRWKIESVGPGYFKVIAECSGKALSTGRASGENGVDVIQSAYRGVPEQQWQIIPVGGRIDEWTFLDVGAPAIPGNAARASDRKSFVVKAAGGDVWGPNDSFHFIEQTVTGNFEIVAHVKSLQQVHEWSKAGLMIRESLWPDARNSFVAISAKLGAAQQLREKTNTETTSTKVEGPSAPCWLKLQRAGDDLTGAFSIDGATWQKLATVALPKLPATVHAGIAVTSHDNGKATTATIDQITLIRAR
jgi:tRNA A-37 threonylcarbamoyl transferase component Bud32/regulation of enolase protein 1 (concanavalin A-like superfamily)